LALPSSGFIAAIVGSIVGIPALRIKGLYLAIATMSFGFIIDAVIVEWDSLTHGMRGLFALSPSIGPIVFDNDFKKFYLIYAVTIIMLVFAKNIIRSRTGRAFMAIRDSDVAAETMGIDLAKYKIVAFGVSAFYAGISGSLYAHLVEFIAPANFTLLESIAFVIMVVVGGAGSILGSVMGAIFLTILPELIRYTKDYLPPTFIGERGLEAILYGVILIFFIIFEPNGLYGRWLRIKEYWRIFPRGKKMKRKIIMVSSGRRV
jgi:branched-chain amino acid transport system permease protein